MLGSKVGWAVALVVFVALAAGCGVDDEPLRPRVEQSDSNLSSLSVEERLAATENQDERAPDLFERAGSAPEEAVAEYRACREELMAKRSYVNASGMTRLIITVDCMKAKGWTLKEEITPGDGGS